MGNKPSDPYLISTSALAKKLDLPAKTLFELFTNKGWIERVGENWKLTGKGQFEGGDYVASKKYGEYIGWPESVIEHMIFAELFNRPLRTRIIGNELGISAHRFNALLAELGWQKKFHRGWTLTDAGSNMGGSEKEDDESGVPFTLWPRSILENPLLQQSLNAIQINKKATLTESTTSNPSNIEKENQQALNFEEPQTHTELQAMDGHIVDHPEDLALDNWFYLMNVAHAYHRKLPSEDLGCCDFYLPSAHLYIECWHEKDTGTDLNAKLARIEYYQANNLTYLEIGSDDLSILDTILPKRLLKEGITVF